MRADSACLSSFPAGETDRTPSPSVSHPTGSESRLRVDIIPAVEFGTKPSWGLFAAIGTGTIGGYVSFRSNFVSARGSYTIDSGGAISTGGKFWGNGESRYGVHTVTGGALWHPGSGMVGLWIGAGYGICSLVWQDTDGAWAESVFRNYL